MDEEDNISLPQQYSVWDGDLFLKRCYGIMDMIEFKQSLGSSPDIATVEHMISYALASITPETPKGELVLLPGGKLN